MRAFEKSKFNIYRVNDAKIPSRKFHYFFSLNKILKWHFVRLREYEMWECLSKYENSFKSRGMNKRAGCYRRLQESWSHLGYTLMEPDMRILWQFGGLFSKNTRFTYVFCIKIHFDTITLISFAWERVCFGMEIVRGNEKKSRRT